MKKLNFLTKDIITQVLSKYPSPLHIYSKNKLINNCKKLLKFPNAYGLTVRYALKANPHKFFITTIHQQGLHFDASSEYEVMRCLRLGIPAKHIQLTSQEFPKEFVKEIFNQEVLFNACSLHQLESYGKLCPNTNVSFRINLGLGSGSNCKTNVAGPSAAFGIWYEQINEVIKISNKYNLTINSLHSHIGSGTDPKIWQKVAQMILKLAKNLTTVNTINLGGGFKFARMPYEKTTNLQTIGNSVKKAFEYFFQQTKRKLKLEIEPGTYISANTGSIICQVEDLISTGKNGYIFLKLNTGMDAIIRSALYATQHPIIAINNNQKNEDYIIAGHCCESSDIFTINQNEELLPRTLKKVSIGDPIIIEHTGAYCASMSLKNYNSFPNLAELIIKDNDVIEITRKQNFNNFLDREISL